MIKNINEYNREDDITAEEVKAQKEFEHLSDAEANEVVSFIKTYCNLVYTIHLKQIQENCNVQDEDLTNLKIAA